MDNTPYNSDINTLFTSKNETTTDLNKSVQKLRSLKSLKAQIEADKLTEKNHYELDALLLITFENTELEKLRKEILNVYNTKEQNSRTFLDYIYPNIQDRKKAEEEFNEIEKLKNIAKNTFNINERKEILNKINTMTFINKNISSYISEIDTICRTFNGYIYKSIDELEKGLSEEDKLPEFIKIKELLDEHLEISALINIEREFKEIQKFNFSNLDIKNCISEISSKLNSIENKLKNINGRYYESLEEVEKIQNELYYINNESFKFDMNTKDGLSLFLELMSFRDFLSIEAKEKIQEYQTQYIKLNDNFIEKKNMKTLDENLKKNLEYYKTEKYKGLLYKSATYTLRFSIALFIFACIFNSVSINMSNNLGTLSIILGIPSLIYVRKFKKMLKRQNLSDNPKNKNTRF